MFTNESNHLLHFKADIYQDIKVGFVFDRFLNKDRTFPWRNCFSKTFLLTLIQIRKVTNIIYKNPLLSFKKSFLCKPKHLFFATWTPKSFTLSDMDNQSQITMTLKEFKNCFLTWVVTGEKKVIWIKTFVIFLLSSEIANNHLDSS